MPLVERLPITPQTRQWPVWGTVARVVVTDHTMADAAQQLVSALLDRIDLVCSRFRPDSELATVQALAAVRAPGQTPVPVPISPLLADLIAAALDAAQRTDGDVDPTLADDLCALGYDEDFATVQLGTIPVRLVHRVRRNWRDVRLTPGTPGASEPGEPGEPGARSGPRVAMPAGMHLDLGSSAKAYAADRAAQLVHDTLGCGVLVALGGDIAVAGTDHGGPRQSNQSNQSNQSQEGWQVLVQDGEREPASTVSLHSGGLATSSTLSRNWRHGTRTVHHILDPRSGQPAPAVWRTVSVVAGTCAQANMLATASIVRGWKAVAMLRDAGVPARLIGPDREPLLIGGWPAEFEVAA